MAIYSMTGFARIQARVNEQLGYTLSLKSVNHRFLDLQLRMPSGLDSLEMELRRMLKKRSLVHAFEAEGVARVRSLTRAWMRAKPVTGVDGHRTSLRPRPISRVQAAVRAVGFGFESVHFAFEPGRRSPARP